MPLCGTIAALVEPDLCHDHRDSSAHRRGGFLPPGSVGGEAVVLMVWRPRPRVLVTVALACLTLVCAGQTAWAQPRSPGTVLAVFWSSEDDPVNQVHDAGIREGLGSRPDAPIDYHAEYLESDRFPGEEASLAFRDYLHRKYRDRRIDVVIAVTDVALEFMLRYRGELFPDAPIVFFGSKAVDPNSSHDGAGLTGIVVSGVYRETLQLALALHPSTERTFVVLQTPDAAQQHLVQSTIGEISPAATTFIVEESLPRLIAAVEAVPPRSVIVYVQYHAGGSREELAFFRGRATRIDGLAGAGLRRFGLGHRFRRCGRCGIRHTRDRSPPRRDGASDTRWRPSAGHSD